MFNFTMHEPALLAIENISLFLDEKNAILFCKRFSLHRYYIVFPKQLQRYWRHPSSGQLNLQKEKIRLCVNSYVHRKPKQSHMV